MIDPATAPATLTCLLLLDRRVPDGLDCELEAPDDVVWDADRVELVENSSISTKCRLRWAWCSTIRNWVYR